jgi:hypothetical protein
MAKNPWVQSAEREAEVGDGELADAVARATPAPPDLAPQSASVTPPRSGDCFPRRVADTPAGPATMWWMGVHGGAGESTLEQLLEGSRAAGHAWPIAKDDALPAPRVMLVARTTARGLQAAQLAAREWASGTVPVDLVGLVLIADAPGRLPKPLRDLAQVVVGGVPRSWRLPWVEPWRLGESVSETTAPKTMTQLLDELRASYVDEAPASPPNS